MKRTGLEMTIEKCHFGVPEVEFLGRTVTPQGTTPEDPKINKYWANVRFPESKQSSLVIYRYCQLSSQLHSAPVKKLLGFHELLKASVRIGFQTANHWPEIRPNDGR